MLTATYYTVQILVAIVWATASHGGRVGEAIAFI